MHGGQYNMPLHAGHSHALKNALLSTCHGHGRDQALCALALALATVIVADDDPHLLLDKMVTLTRTTVNRKGAPMKYSNIHS
jgi:hypothetical protein